jgi:signal transduction histidine kinase
MKSFQTQDEIAEPEHAAVFRDFERSRIEHLRSDLQSRFWPLTLIYILLVTAWTIVMSYGTAKHGNSSLGYSLTPHISYFTLIVGLIVYPRNRLWVPVLVFSALFPIPFFFYDAEGTRWLDDPNVTLGLVSVLYAGQMTFGLLIGGSARLLAKITKRFFSPYIFDLITIFSVFLIFALAVQVHMVLVWWHVHTVPNLDLIALGFGSNFLHDGTQRALRGANVAAVFLLLVMIAPDRKEVLKGLALAATFPLLILAQNSGFVMHPTVDVLFIGAFIALTLPLGVAISALIIGIPIYSGMTGAFVSTPEAENVQAGWLEIYSTIGLTFIILIIALRAHLNHAGRVRAASVRRMGMVRDFANVGLLSFNLSQGRYRADSSCQRILPMRPEGEISDLLQSFDGKDLAELTEALKPGLHGQITLLLSHSDNTASQAPQILRLFLWYEMAPSGDEVGYGLALDVTNEHQQERKLQETFSELSSRQERQRQLFSIVSHELRTPASVISMLVDELNDFETLPRSRKLLRDATDQLLSTLADMRQTVNPAKNLPLKMMPYTAADTAESIRNMFLAQAEERGITIRLLLGDDAQRVRIGDQMRVRQALSNLLRNAIIHSHASEVSISFKGELNGGGIHSVWSIVDNGIGIPASEVDRLFEPFERGAQDPRSHVDGSGLGLFIAKSSIEMLGGTLRHFQPAAGGTGYTISLFEALPEGEASGRSVKAPAVPKAENFPELHILLAEDNKLVAEVTQARLQRFVGRVDVVHDGAQALLRIAETSPDLLITDLFMPGMDGDALVRTLREAGRTLPIVGISAAVVGDDMDRFKSAGADFVMSKPFEIRHLRQILSDLHQKKRLEQRRVASRNPGH